MIYWKKLLNLYSVSLIKYNNDLDMLSHITRLSILKI